MEPQAPSAACSFAFTSSPPPVGLPSARHPSSSSPAPGHFQHIELLPPAWGRGKHPDRAHLRLPGWQGMSGKDEGMFPAAGSGVRDAGPSPGDGDPSSHSSRWLRALAPGRITSSYGSGWRGGGREVVPALRLGTGCHPGLSQMSHICSGACRAGLQGCRVCLSVHPLGCVWLCKQGSVQRCSLHFPPACWRLQCSPSMR